jgi:hypothetical protein
MAFQEGSMRNLSIQDEAKMTDENSLKNSESQGIQNLTKNFQNRSLFQFELGQHEIKPKITDFVPGNSGSNIIQNFSGNQDKSFLHKSGQEDLDFGSKGNTVIQSTTRSDHDIDNNVIGPEEPISEINQSTLKTSSKENHILRSPDGIKQLTHGQEGPNFDPREMTEMNTVSSSDGTRSYKNSGQKESSVFERNKLGLKLNSEETNSFISPKGKTKLKINQKSSDFQSRKVIGIPTSSDSTIQDKDVESLEQGTISGIKKLGKTNSEGKQLLISPNKNKKLPIDQESSNVDQGNLIEIHNVDGRGSTQLSAYKNERSKDPPISPMKKSGLKKKLLDEKNSSLIFPKRNKKLLIDEKAERSIVNQRNPIEIHTVGSDDSNRSDINQGSKEGPISQSELDRKLEDNKNFASSSEKKRKVTQTDASPSVTLVASDTDQVDSNHQVESSVPTKGPSIYRQERVNPINDQVTKGGGSNYLMHQLRNKTSKIIIQAKLLKERFGGICQNFLRHAKFQRDDQEINASERPSSPLSGKKVKGECTDPTNTKPHARGSSFDSSGTMITDHDDGDGRKWSNADQLLAYLPKPSSKSSQVSSISSEEQSMLDLIQEMQHPPESTIPLTKFPLKFPVDYAGQIQSLERALKRHDQSPRRPPGSSSSLSILSPLEIQANEAKKAIEQELDDVYKAGLNPDLHHSQPPSYKSTKSKSLPINHNLSSKSSASTLKRLRMFSEPTIKTLFARWGQDLLDWEHQKLDISLMARLAVVLNLEHKHEHCGISGVEWVLKDPTMYERFQGMSWKERSAVLGAIRKALGKAESTRRLYAFFRLLRCHSISRRWRVLKAYWIKEKMMTVRQAEFFARRFGLSEDPQKLLEIPKPIRGPKHIKDEKDRTGKLQTSEAVWNVYGQFEGEERLKLIYYLRDRIHCEPWWDSFKLEAATRQFGLEVLGVILIGDGLQFGWKNQILEDADKKIIEGVFVQLLVAIVRDDLILPWLESPERAWLYRTCGDLYQDRLRGLSLWLFNRGGGMALKGTEVLWADLGLDPSLLLDYQNSHSPEKQSAAITRSKEIVAGWSEYEQLACSIWHRVFCLDLPHSDPVFSSLQLSAHQSRLKEIRNWASSTNTKKSVKILSSLFYVILFTYFRYQEHQRYAVGK